MITLAEAEFKEFDKICHLIINDSIPADRLRHEVMQLKSLVLSLFNMGEKPPMGNGSSETVTHNGLAISPNNAGFCLDDYIRTVTYIRGLNDLINDLLTEQKQRVEVLYVGCGPFASLVLPLLHLFANKPVYFTLVDIHQESINSVISIVNGFKLNEKINHAYCQDVMMFKPIANYNPNIILSEVMQAALNKEPQVAVNRYLKQLFPHAKIIPESIQVELKWINPIHEFDPNCLRKAQHRIESGCLFTLDETNLLTWQTQSADQANVEFLPAECITLPESLTVEDQPMLFTSITVYKEQQLLEYQSGLTSPVQAVISGDISKSKQILFRYCLGNNPGLIGKAI